MTPKRGKFATKTDVTEEKSRQDIEHILKKYGATGYGPTWESTPAGTQWQIKFRIKDRFVQMDFIVPALGKQATRSFWRAIYNVIKFKLEAVEIGYSTIEREFLADILLPNDTVLGAWILPQLDLAYKSGKMPPMLPEAKKTQ